MFWNRYREAFIVGLSLLAGIVLTVLAFLNLLVIGALIPALGAGFGALCLWIAAFVSASLLRQSPEYERCVCARALRTVVSALGADGRGRANPGAAPARRVAFADFAVSHFHAQRVRRPLAG